MECPLKKWKPVWVCVHAWVCVCVCLFSYSFDLFVNCLCDLILLPIMMLDLIGVCWVCVCVCIIKTVRVRDEKRKNQHEISTAIKQMNPKRESHSAAVLFFKKKDIHREGGRERWIKRRRERERGGHNWDSSLLPSRGVFQRKEWMIRDDWKERERS